MERVEDPLLTERVELERLDVAGATLLTEDVLLLDCCDDTLRVELELLTLRVELLEVLPDTLRLELLVLFPATLRLEVLPATLRLEVLPATLRLLLEPDTLRLEVEELLATDLEATPDEAGVTVRLALVPNDAVRLVVLRLRLRSHPPLLMLRLGANRSARLVLTDTYAG